MKSSLFGLQSHPVSKNPILVIDRTGLIGEPLSLKLSKEFLVVFVSKNALDLDLQNQNIVHVPFSGKFPVIPDSKYSHIIFIDTQSSDLEFLPKIIKKAKDVNSDFIAALGLSAKGEYEVDKILRLYSSSKVVIIGDIFDGKLILKKENFKSAINKFIYQAQSFGKIQIPGDGLKETYPVFLQDVVNGLIDLVFKIHKSHSLFYIFPKHPPSELSLAHMIQKINPEVTVDFIKNYSKLENISYPPNGLNLLDDKYPLAKKIKEIDVKNNLSDGEKIRQESSHENTKKLRSFSFFVIWVLIFLLLSPLVFTIIFSFLGLNTLYHARGEIDKNNFANTKSSLRLSQAFFYVGKQASSILSLQAKIIGAEKNLKRLLEDIDLGYKISGGLLQAFNSEIYFSKILNGKSENSLEDFAKGESYLKNSIVALNKVRAEGKIPAPILQKLDLIDPLIKVLSTTEDIMPGILGMEGPRTYLILFQNNMELRPGGGFIGSYGILRLNMGKVNEFSIHDVYDADGQLRGHVEPPFAVRRYLPSAHWYMRDSNFDVDFVKSALSSSNFLFLETGQKVSGVIAVDVSFVKSILHAIGPVYVADYRETVDENNLYMLTQSHAEKNFFPGSTQKKDFLRSLYKTIMAKIIGEKIPYLLIVQAISDSLNQKHLMFALNDDSQNILTVNGWSSSLWDEREDSVGHINDFVGINEANLGVNKANYFMKRQVSQKTTIEDDGNILEELIVSYENGSTAWPGGDYKNYLRIILPKNTKLSEILIDDISQDIVDAVTNPLVYEVKNFKAPKGLEVEKVVKENKNIYGFIVNVPVEKTIKVKVKYELFGSVPGLNTFSYNLKLFKQPGVDSIPYSFSLTYPDSFNIIKSSDGIKGGGGKASYFEKIVGDKNLIINFAKK